MCLLAVLFLPVLSFIFGFIHCSVFMVIFSWSTFLNRLSWPTSFLIYFLEAAYLTYIILDLLSWSGILDLHHSWSTFLKRHIWPTSFLILFYLLYLFLYIVRVFSSGYQLSKLAIINCYCMSTYTIILKCPFEI